MPTVAQALGLREIANRDPMEVLKDVLVASPEPVLLVLDNFEQVLDAASLLTHLLDGCANLKILVTSRAMLRVYGDTTSKFRHSSRRPEPRAFRSRTFHVTPLWRCSSSASQP